MPRISREDLIAISPDSFKKGHIFDRVVARRNLLEVKEVFDEVSLDFWLWFGTFLGILRDGDLIPWDGDVDLAIFVSGVRKLNCALESLEERGFKSTASCLLKDGEHIDISVFVPEASGKDTWVAGPIEISADDFKTPNYIEFLGVKWRILNNPDRWLTYLYGENWWKYPCGTFSELVIRGRPFGHISYRYESQGFSRTSDGEIAIVYSEDGENPKYIQEVILE